MLDVSRQLEPEIQSLLDRLRGRIRAYVWSQGIAIAFVLLASAFWLSLLLDWSFEPPRAVRLAAILLTLLALAAVIYRQIIRRAFVDLPDSSLALLLERRFSQFDDSLVTAVELRNHRDEMLAAESLEEGQFDPRMLAAARRRAAKQSDDVDIGSVFRRKPIAVALGTMLLLVASMMLLALTRPTVMATWASRNLLLSNELWPRKTRLIVDGFDGGVIKVARGTDLQVTVKADMSKELVPESVRIRYVQEDVAQQSVMTRIGEATYPQDDFQQYSFTFKSILSPITFEVRGGDDRVRGLRIEAVDSPLLTEMTLDVSYPAYTGRSDREQLVSGIMAIPAGSKVQLSGRANKELAQVTLHRLQGDKTELLDKVDLSSRTPADTLSYPLGIMNEDQTVLLTLLDRDNISSRDPIRLVLSAVPDEAPKMNVRLRSIGQAITPQAMLPVAGEISDDFGLGRIWIEYGDEGAQALSEQEIRPASPADPQTDRIRLGGASAPMLDVRDKGLAIGQKLLVTVKASDLYSLADAAHVSASEKYSLDVVSPPQLLATLEARELMLRRRLESAIDLITQMRTSLAGIRFENAPAENASGADTSPSALRMIAVRRAIGDSQHTGQEALSLANAFEEIHEELLNNRLDASEKKSRLLEGIARPLRRAGEEQFVELDSRLRRLESSIDSPQSGPDRQTAALAQTELVLAELHKVLEQMLKLEDFNQLVEMLRGVIELQEDLNSQTAKKQKESARDLLE